MSQDNSSPLRIPAAQYLRMSKEQQQYSLVNQADAIKRYADEHGFEIVQTYSDAGRSGLLLKRRAGLARLLQDVVGGGQPYKAILVYDVSRWGRFQDTDEAAHYEFLCRHAGIPVHYCAEQFSNDGTLPSSIMKALKRAMAGEDSRELSTKVYAGKRRLRRVSSARASCSRRQEASKESVIGLTLPVAVSCVRGGPRRRAVAHPEKREYQHLCRPRSFSPQ